MADINIDKFRTTVVREGSRPASAGFVESEGQDPVDPAGSPQDHLPVTIAASANALSITTSQVLSGAGTVAQYIRGDGSLADFPESSGGGSSVSYYLNGSVDQGTIGGIAYKELSKVPILGAGTDFSINADGYIASFITDAGDPSLLEIPGGNWNFETYFSASSSGGTPTFYVELYKVSSGGTATLIASSSSSPELIAFGTNLNPYFSTLAVPTTTLALTDRLAVRYYVTHSGRTITLHTENNHLCQIVTTFTTGITALNGLTAQVQNFAVGTTGTDFNIASATATHTFNLPTASATNRGALSSADWSLFTQAYNDKINSAAVTGTTTKTLTLTQQDGGTITASWSDLNTDAVLSVFGRTGAVVAANGDYTTAQVTESGNLYYTDARSRAALSFAAGSGAYNTSTGVITIPTNNNQITNGAGYITSAALAGYLPLSGGVMTGPITTPNGTFGIVIGDDSRLADRNIANTLFLEGVQNNDRGYINFSQTTGNALGAINGGDLTWRGNAVVTGSASAGQVAYWSSASAITGESALFWDATNNRLGIDNASPDAPIHANGGASMTGGWNRTATLQAQYPVLVYNSNGSKWGGIGYDHTAGLRIWVNSSSFDVSSGTNALFINNIGAATFISSITASSIIRSGGTSSQYLMADGSVSTLSNPVTGTGTTNYLPKFTGSTTIGNSALYDAGGFGGFNSTGLGSRTFVINAASGRPLALELIENANVHSIFFRPNNSGYNLISSNYISGGVYLPLSLSARENNSDFILNTSGNLGLGVTPSAWFSTVKAIDISTATALWAGGNGQPALGYNVFVNTSGNLIYKTSEFASRYEQISGQHQWFTAPSGTAGNAISFTQAMTLTSGGNLLVGTPTDNGARLQVSGTGVAFNFTTSNGLIGNINSSAANGGYVTWQTSGTTIADLGTAQQVFGAGGNDTFGINARGARSLILGTNNTGRLTIDSTGAATFSSSVNVGGVSANTDFRIYRTVAPSVFFYISAPGGTPNTSTLGVNGTDVMVLNASGNVGIGTPSPIKMLQVFAGNGDGIATGRNATNDNVSANLFLYPSALTTKKNWVISAFYTRQTTLQFLYSSTSTSDPYDTGTPLMTLEGASGNVLIGTVSDNGSRLRVNGTIWADSSITATSFFESSDATLKTLVEDNYQAKGIESVVAKLYIKNGKQELGYFAQDLQGVLPSSVSKGSDGLLNLSYREVHTAKIAYLEEEIRQIKKRYEIN